MPDVPLLPRSVGNASVCVRMLEICSWHSVGSLWVQKAGQRCKLCLSSLLVKSEGELGVFDLQTLLVTLTPSLTLLALAATAAFQPHFPKSRVP